MEDDVFGYKWDDIQRAQQRGRLSRTIDVSKPSVPTTTCTHPKDARGLTGECLLCGASHEVTNHDM